MNSPRSVLLATMPPTFEAARNTACGRLLANQSNTAAWSRKSTSPRPAVCRSTSSRARRRTSAAPTIPLCPATKTVFPFRSNGVLAIGNLAPRDRKVARDHLLHKLGKARLRFPAELLARLAGVADQKVDFGRAEVHGVDANHGLAGLPVGAGLLHALAAPLDAAPQFGERQFDEFAHRAHFARCQHEIAGFFGLQYLVHALDIILGVAPVAFGIEVSEIERVFQAGLDAGNAAGDLAGDKGLAADRALVIEQDAVRGEHAIGLAVVNRDPVAIQLGDAIGRTRIERGSFLLRLFLHQAVKFRGRRLIEARFLFHAENPDR